ncbi:methylmalonyl-CoA mutase family protein [Weeksellaceae bacterium A-14]|uniref:methylmalonyl-CoA mutase family protein n=1 Tax=Daejeonia sp. YH14 TaxID=3439042 RepID=UPI0031E4AA5C
MNTKFQPVSLQDWEQTVLKQLKTDDIYSILEKENLEGLQIRPYYASSVHAMPTLPKVEESTHLVSPFCEEWQDEAYAFLLKQNITGLENKTFFIDHPELAEHIIPEDSNAYLCLIDIADDNAGTLNLQLGKELLAKGFDRSLCVDISFHQNAGAGIVQQLAFALGKAKELTEVFGPQVLDQLVFRMATGANYFFEIAKIRAFKILFNQFSKEFGRDDIPYIFAETSLRNKSLHDEENNLIRSTLELAAAMIGGADAVYSNSYKIENASPLSDEISFKQQIVLAYESIINVFQDAASGSYYVEELTHQMAEKAWDYFLKTEESGGYLASVRNGKIQKAVYEHAVAEQQWVEEGKIKLVGVNIYPKLELKKPAAELYSEYELKPVRWAEAYE